MIKSNKLKVITDKICKMQCSQQDCTNESFTRIDIGCFAFQLCDEHLRELSEQTSRIAFKKQHQARINMPCSIKVRISGVYRVNNKHGFAEYKHLVTGIEGEFDDNRIISGIMFHKDGTRRSGFVMHEYSFLEEIGYVDTTPENFALKLEEI